MVGKIQSLLTCKESTTHSESTNYSNEFTQFPSNLRKLKLFLVLPLNLMIKSPLLDRLRNCRLVVPLSRLKKMKSLISWSLKVSSSYWRNKASKA